MQGARRHGRLRFASLTVAPRGPVQGLFITRMKNRIAGIGWALAIAAAAAPALAQSDQPTLDELLDLAPPEASPESPPEASPETTPAEGQDPSQQPEPAAPADDEAGGTEVDPALRQTLEEGNPADALEAAVRQMDVVSQRLGRERDAGRVTQREQESILRKLDQVIAAARRQQQGGGGGGGGQPQPQQARQQDAGGSQVAQQGEQQGQGQPQAAGSQASSGAASRGGVADAAADQPIEELRKEWGRLPPRLRNELTEGLTQPFSPVYRDLTEAYYRALAEEDQ